MKYESNRQKWYFFQSFTLPLGEINFVKNSAFRSLYNHVDLIPSFFQLNVQSLRLVVSSKPHQTIVWHHRRNTIPNARSHVHRDTIYKVLLRNSAGLMVNGRIVPNLWRARVSFLYSVSFLTKISFICNTQIVTLISDTDECAVSNGGCSHECVNIVGGYKCECPDLELSLSSDNKTCHG